MKEKEISREEKVKMYEPKRNNRFVVKFPEKFKIEPWVVSKITRPSYYVEGNSWDPITINFFDPIGPSTSQKLFILVKEMNEDKLDKEFTFTIETLDPVGVVVELWEITGKISLIEFGSKNDYNNAELRELTVEVKPTNCVLKY